MLIHKIIRRIVYRYIVNEERSCIEKYGKFGVNTKVEYPYMISHHELIYLGDNVHIMSDSRIQLFPELTNIRSNIIIGDNCFIGQRFCLLAGGNIEIGNDASIANDVCIVSENHGMNPLEKISYGGQPLSIADVKIGNGVWLGNGVKIMPGVYIGDKSIIGAGSVVTTSIPEYCIAAGVPAKIIKRYNFEEKEWKRV